MAEVAAVVVSVDVTDAAVVAVVTAAVAAGVLSIVPGAVHPANAAIVITRHNVSDNDLLMLEL